MPHATHSPRRIRTSEAMHAPVRSNADRLGKQLQLGFAVGLTMVVIVGLYAASFRYQGPVRVQQSDAPRWSFLDPDLFARTEPVRGDLAAMKATLVKFASSGSAQAQAAVILKRKLETRAASGTPETAEPPETPETP